MPDLTDAIRDEILNSVSDLFGIRVYDSTPIKQGYLNLKWKIETDAGSFFVKQYNKQRYPEKLVHHLEISLSHQANLQKQGIPAPALFSHQGRYVIRTPSQERFVLMSYCEGRGISPGTVNEHQAYSLGNAIGKMHHLLNSNLTEVPPLHWEIQSKEDMRQHWEKRWNHANALHCEKTIRALEVQKSIIEEIDLDMFSTCEHGWAHWDVFVDNLLFTDDSLSAILDFDRMHFVYPEFDISRAILSCTLDHAGIQLDKVSAFVAGYRAYQPLSLEKLVRSIKLTWWKEAEWVTVEGEQDSKPLKRFREENLWIADHWHHLHEMFSNMI